MTDEQIHRLIDTLQVPKDQVFETHISWVLLKGDFAFKIKKPVKFSFLDFSTSKRRLDALERELKLNSRLSPEIYIGIEDIVENGREITILPEGGSATIDHCLKMKKVNPNLQMDHLLRADEVSSSDIEDLAEVVADFHLGAKVNNDRRQA